MTNNIATLLKIATHNLKPLSDSPELDSEVLLCHVLKKNRSHLRAWPEALLLKAQLQQFNQLIAQRQQGHPIAYLISSREFWSRDFIVTPDVLIPRPDTETLIEICLQLLVTKNIQTVIDLGTGSGNIAIILAAEHPKIHVTALDQSLKALKIAQQNAQRHNTQHIQFLHSNWFSAVPAQKFDMIISNPPYIDPEDTHLSQGDIRFEPLTALSAPQKGLHDIQSIIKDSRDYLADNAYLILEHGYNQQQAVHVLFKQYQYHSIHCILDLAGHPRVSYAQYQPHVLKIL